MTTRLYHPTLRRRFVDVEGEEQIDRHLEAGWKKAPLMPNRVGEEPPVDPTAPPKGSASKRAWVDYAVLRGADRDDAESMSRDELRDIYSPE